MADVRAFPALRYNDSVDLAAVTCPPYDVLSATERRALFERSPYAAVRAILPDGEPDPASANSRYTNAANLLSEWQKNGVLVQDSQPALYVTQTEFVEPGATLPSIRYGLVGALRLHEYKDGVVLPHEKTLDKPKKDRLNLLRATRANVESILCLADDDDGTLLQALMRAAKNPSIASFIDEMGHKHTLHTVTDEEAARMSALLEPRRIYIADGHHRYETSLAYAREQNALGSDRPEAFLLATIVSAFDPGLSVLPTHRLVKGTPADALNSIFAHLEPVFDILEVDVADIESRLRVAFVNQPVLGMVLPSGTVYQLTLRNLAALPNLLPASVVPALHQLEPVILQYLILGPAFGLRPEEIATTDRLAYTRDTQEAVRLVHYEGEFDAAFLLGRPAPTAVRDVSLAGEVMPQKSTFYYPKLVSGLIMRSL